MIRNHELRITNYEINKEKFFLRITSYELRNWRITNYLRITNYEIGQLRIRNFMFLTKIWRKILQKCE